MAELVVGEPEPAHGGGGVATTDDRESVDLGECLRDGLRARGERLELEDAISDLEKTITVVDGMLKEREAAETTAPRRVANGE